tara:strand:- start:1599 stop:1781 length:183 start_codon:yes stop_codon:yes gene_type:complete
MASARISRFTMIAPRSCLSVRIADPRRREKSTNQTVSGTQMKAAPSIDETVMRMAVAHAA